LKRLGRGLLCRRPACVAARYRGITLPPPPSQRPGAPSFNRDQDTLYTTRWPATVAGGRGGAGGGAVGHHAGAAGGRRAPCGGGAGLSPAGWTLPLPSWVPWHPPVVRRGYAILGPLPPTARAAVLRFMNGETVRVPLNLTALRQRRAYSGPLVQRNGLQFQVA